MQSFIVGPQEAGCRLDRIVRKRLKLQSLAAIYKLLRTGKIRIDGKKSTGADWLTEGCTVTLDIAEAELLPAAAPAETVVKNLVNTDFFAHNFKVIHEDSSLLALNKPCGLVVHPGSGHEEHTTLVDMAYSYMLSKNPAAEKAELVHRLDRDTSGVILLAKTKPVLRALHEQVRDRNIAKEYLAICYGKPPGKEDTIESELVRTFAVNDGTKMKVSRQNDEEDSFNARLSYRVLETNERFSKLAITLHTGRTHQIRVQCAHIGCPLVGDLRYGDENADKKLFLDRSICRRLYLHAHKLGVMHPATKKNIVFVAPAPEAFARFSFTVAR